jgi:hypothetical protein
MAGVNESITQWINGEIFPALARVNVMGNILCGNIIMTLIVYRCMNNL